MKTIKVRCWDDESEKMIYSDSIDDVHFFHFNEKGLLKCYRIIDTVTSEGFPESETEELNNDPELCINLPDKNGKMIYESDIIKWLGHEAKAGKQIRPERIITANFDNIPELFRLNNITGAGYLEPEIIGNVHENPKRLNG